MKLCDFCGIEMTYVYGKKGMPNYWECKPCMHWEYDYERRGFKRLSNINSMGKKANDSKKKESY